MVARFLTFSWSHIYLRGFSLKFFFDCPDLTLYMYFSSERITMTHFPHLIVFYLICRKNSQFYDGLKFFNKDFCSERYTIKAIAIHIYIINLDLGKRSSEFKDKIVTTSFSVVNIFRYDTLFDMLNFPSREWHLHV